MLELFCDNSTWFLSDDFSIPRLLAVPHLSKCAQESILVLIPCTFFLAFLPVVLYALHTSTNGPLKAASPITFRIVFCFLIQQFIGVIILFRLGAFANENNDNVVLQQSLRGDGINSVSYLALEYVVLCVVLLATLASRNRGLLTSGVFFNFWFLMTLCGLPCFYFHFALLAGDVQQDTQIVESILFLIAYFLIFATFFFSCFVDVSGYRQANDKTTCPERMTSFLNQITFFWFGKLTSIGFKKPLTMDDLWDPPDESRSKYLFAKFNAIWTPYIHKFHVKQQRKRILKKVEKVALPMENSFSESQALYPKSLTDDAKIEAIKDVTGDDAVLKKPSLLVPGSAVSNGKNENKQKKANKKEAKLKDENVPSVMWPLVRMFKWTLIGAAFYKLIFDVLQFVSPQLLKYLIDFIQHNEQPMWIGIGIASAMFGVALVQSLVVHQYFHMMFSLGMHIRAVLTSAVYKKALLLSSTARRGRTIGEIVNLMSIDIQRFQDITSFIMLFWSSPLQVLLATYFLWQLLGVSIFAGLSLLIALIPFNSFVSVKMRNYQMEQMRYKDERMKVMAEMLNGIKVLKLYAWEASMQKMVLDIRRRERAVLRRLALINAAVTLTWSCAPFLVAVLTFGIYVNLDPEKNVLTPQITFVGLSLFNILRFPLAVFAMIVNQLMQCVVGYRRLSRFLADEEIDQSNSENSNLLLSDTEIAVSLQNASHSWERDGDDILRNISIKIKKGELVAVVGRIGSGKSSLLSAILGEMYRHNGKVATNGKIAYVQQQAWIQNLTLMENILFGKSMNAKFYADTLEACCLKSDLESLPAGDHTEIGEKGINLSGGQKQRVSMARAVYAEADIYLLDDPLAAVDAHVGKQIFDNVIGSKKGLLKEKTRIFVTHSLQFLKYCDKIVVLKDGEVSELGTFKELVSANGAFSEILEEFLLDEALHGSFDQEDDDDDISDVLAELGRISPERKQNIVRRLSEKASSHGSLLTSDSNDTSNDEKILKHFNSKTSPTKANQAADHKSPLSKKIGVSGKEQLNITAVALKPPLKSTLIEQEVINSGNVKFSVYMTYFYAIGLPVCCVFIFIYFLASLLGVASNLWLADWSDHAIEIQTQSNNSFETHKRLFIYTSLGLGQAIFVTIASVLMSFGMVTASVFLHERMLKNILRAPMAFFDVTPIGRILNRFGKDLDFVDSRLPATLINCFGTALQSVTTLAVPIIVTPLASLPIVFVLGLYIYVTRYYVSTSRQLKRLESTTRSPIFAHFQESIQGASSIRAFGVAQKFLAESQKRVDYNLKANYPSLVANRWLAVRLELVGNFIVLCAALFSSLFRDSVTAGLAGLSVSYALSITQTLNWAVRMSSELEANIVAVERIEEYSNLPTESSTDTLPELGLNEDWPQKGVILLDNVELRYRPELDFVLKGISAQIKSQEKIGIIGRTGAGKSSLTLALFRLVEPSNGQIVIDDLNIANVGLHDLRSRLTIVPQDPVLFSGTFRQNLDPFNKYSDKEIEQAIQLTHLSDFLSGLHDGLEHKISEGGENISVGQRQLICLARAVLRRSKILVLDEAAASVDVETDQLIQKTIREQFSTCTVLTIAHRLHSVLDSDRLMVFEQGELVEFDTPDVLLARSDSFFHALAVDAGILSASKKASNAAEL